MSTEIHSSSVVSSNARIGEGVTIGPFCVVEDDVQIGDGTTLMSHVVLGNGSRLGNDVRVHPGAVIGTAPQDLKFGGEKTYAFVGDRTVVRECATINLGTSATGETRVGADCLLMAYTHVAHDCILGDHVIMANSVDLGGHVEVGDWAIIGGISGVHQFVRIGAHAMVGGLSKATQDVPAYTLAGRSPLVVEGLNLIGLRRRGFDQLQLNAIQGFYDALYKQGLNVSDALKKYEDETTDIHPLVADIIAFIRSSKRGICRMHHARS